MTNQLEIINLRMKFRVWNSESQTMAYFWLLDETLQETISKDFWNNPIIMQYTWLKDKNWKEVYESDIVKIKFDYAENILDIYKWVEIINIMTYTLWDDNMHDIVNVDEKYLEVIWNIYENLYLIIKRQEVDG